MTEPGAPGEIKALTGVRAYAAVWVMMLHLPFSQGVMPHVRPGEIAAHGAWGVDIFFVLSGFILSLLYAPRLQQGAFAPAYRAYLAARFARIYPLHVFTIALLAAYYVPKAVAFDARLPGFTFRDLALNLSLLHGWGYAGRLNWNYPSWSISCEWFAYLLLTPALTLGLRRLAPLLCLALALALWTGLYFGLHSTGAEIRHQTIQWGVPRILAEFTLGYALYRVYQRVRLAPAAADALAVGGVAAIVALSLLPPAAEWWLVFAMGALVLGLSQAGPLGNTLFANRAAVFWGERSYAIYMLHAVVQISCNLLLQRLGLTALTPVGGWILFGLLSVAVLAASHFAYVWLEMPARVWLRDRLAGTRR